MQKAKEGTGRVVLWRELGITVRHTVFCCSCPIQTITWHHGPFLNLYSLKFVCCNSVYFPPEFFHSRSVAMRPRYRTKVPSAAVFPTAFRDKFHNCDNIASSLKSPETHCNNRFSSCCHFNVSHYLHLGFCFCDVILDFWDPDQVLQSHTLTSCPPSPHFSFRTHTHIVYYSEPLQCRSARARCQW